MTGLAGHAVGMLLRIDLRKILWAWPRWRHGSARTAPRCPACPDRWMDRRHVSPADRGRPRSAPARACLRFWFGPRRCGRSRRSAGPRTGSGAPRSQQPPRPGNARTLQSCAERRSRGSRKTASVPTANKPARRKRCPASFNMRIGAFPLRPVAGFQTEACSFAWTADYSEEETQRLYVRAVTCVGDRPKDGGGKGSSRRCRSGRKGAPA